jgi:hypothetical protein
VRCANCGGAHVAAFCAECGQRTHSGRFELRRLAATAADEILRFDRGLLLTAVDLTRRPGAMLHEYLSGRTRPWTDPLKYLLIMVAFATLTYTWSGIFRLLLPATTPDGGELSASQTMVLETFTRYFNVILAFGVPFMAIGSRLVFRRSGFNMAEHLIVNLYAYGHICLLSVAFLPLFLLGGSAEFYVITYSVGMMAYYVFVLRRFFDIGWVSATYRGSVIMGFAYLAYVMVAVLAALIVRRV